MERKFIIRKLALLILPVLLLGLSSCDVDTVDRPFVVGDWILVESAGIPVDSRYDFPDYYHFYDTGEGLYEYYDYYGNLATEHFFWEIDVSDMLVIDFTNPRMRDLFWYYDYDGWNMYLSDYPDFRVCDVYEPMY